MPPPHLTWFGGQLDAADQIADVSCTDLQKLLRRAALRLRNVEGDWLISGGRLSVDRLDEESETDGSAKRARKLIKSIMYGEKSGRYQFATIPQQLATL
jgi:hypothetical protein